MPGGYYRQVAREAAAQRAREAEQQAKYEIERKGRLEETAPMREYEAARMGRGKLALGGRYNVAEDPRFRSIRAGLAKSQGQSMSDLEATIAKSELPGFSASYLSDKMKETGANTILNLAASLEGRQQEMIEEGSAAGSNIYAMLAPEQAAEMALRGQSQEAAYAGNIQAGNLIQSKNAAQAQAWSSICCYIFYSGQVPLFYIREYKDEHYASDSDVAIGYKGLALWLVPKMKKYEWVKKITRILMLYPMVWYAEAFYNRKYIKMIALRPISLCWVFIYMIIGKMFRYSVTWTDYLELSKESMGA